MLEKESATTPLSLHEREAVIGDVVNELFGLGPLKQLLKDPTISDILVNRFDRCISNAEGGWRRRTSSLPTSGISCRSSNASSAVSAVVSTSRVRWWMPVLLMAPASTLSSRRWRSTAPAVSIRRFRTDRLGAQDLVGRVSLTQPMLDFLRAAVACRFNILVSGGTGAGKTTLLNILSSFISDRERIVTIEDAAELMLRQRHVVRLETRPANIEGRGAVRQRDLVVNALRMRPDRIVVGEVRSEEALDMLQAMNTGHDGSLTTVHANSARDALYRLDTMIAMANLNIPERAVRQQISSAIDLVVQITRLSDGTRKVTGITEITGMEGDAITMQDLFLFERTGLRADGGVMGRFRATGIRPKSSDRLAASGVHLPAEMFEHMKVVA